MNRSRPTISVVMPNYNHARELRQSLPAIINQLRAPDEIIVVNDGSTDESLDYLHEAASGCPALRIVNHSTRKGVVEAVNRGIRESTGDYVILASADERVMPELCRDMEAAQELFPQAHLFVARYTRWYPETGELGHGYDGELDLWFLDGDQPVWVSREQLERLLRKRHLRLSSNSAMFRRSALFDAGLFDSNLGWYSDWFVMYTTALRHGFCAVPRVLSWFRVSDSSYSAVGSSQPSRQRGVVSGLLDKLDTEEFADIRKALFRSPLAMTPFFRTLVRVLIATPWRYGALLRILPWYIKEIASGRRPHAWARTTIACRLRHRSNERSMRGIDRHV